MAHETSHRVLAALLVLGLATAAPPAGGGELSCDGTMIVFEAGEPEIGETLCGVVLLADGVMHAMGLAKRDGLAIRIVDRLSEEQPANVIAQYHVRKNEIRILDFPVAVGASRQQAPAFGLPMTKLLWHSYLVHEMAHAAAEPRFAAHAQRFAASEYIAAVAQITSLGSALRREVLSAFFDTDAFVEPEEITSLYYLMDPCRFMVKAYRHYRARADGPAFVAQLLKEGLPDH